jgi:hypothetical protein
MTTTETKCYFCGARGNFYDADRRWHGFLSGNHWTGTEYVRVDVCDAHASSLAKAPRKPRQKRQPQPLYGDMAWLAAINGVRTDGTGRRAR